MQFGIISKNFSFKFFQTEKIVFKKIPSNHLCVEFEYFYDLSSRFASLHRNCRNNKDTKEIFESIMEPPGQYNQKHQVSPFGFQKSQIATQPFLCNKGLFSYHTNQISF